jgi:hypothetical protein
LVDKDYKTFKGMHAGGLVHVKNMLHVPDTRKGKNLVHIFSLNKIIEVPMEFRKFFFNYKYILKEEASYTLPIRPSFFSYNFKSKEILTGTFNKCRYKNKKDLSCLLDKKNCLMLYNPNKLKKTFKISFPYFSEMQGAAIIKDPNSQNDILFISTSYGQFKSHLYIVNVNSKGCYTNGIGMFNYRVILYPPGLEDITITKNVKRLWMLTEFSSYKVNKNFNRVVFSIKISHFCKLLKKLDN